MAGVYEDHLRHPCRYGAGAALRHVLAHIFNHQTHHRGQAHDLLCQNADVVPVIDPIAYQRYAMPPDSGLLTLLQLTKFDPGQCPVRIRQCKPFSTEVNKRHCVAPSRSKAQAYA